MLLKDDLLQNVAGFYASLQIVLKETLLSKKYVFQFERGEKMGLLHLQGYMNLSKRKRLHQVFNTLNNVGANCWVKPAMDERFMWAYCSKKKTQVSPPCIYPP